MSSRIETPVDEFERTVVGFRGPSACLPCKLPQAWRSIVLVDVDRLESNLPPRHLSLLICIVTHLVNAKLTLITDDRLREELEQASTGIDYMLRYIFNYRDEILFEIAKEQGDVTGDSASIETIFTRHL